MSQTPLAYQSFVGVDLHKCTVTLAAVDPRRETLSKLTIRTKAVGKIEAWLVALPRPSHLAVEAGGFVEWFIDRFRSCVDRIDIADATERAHRRGKRRKSDPNDARDVAKRLALPGSATGDRDSVNGPTDANKVLFSPEHTRRHGDRRVR